VSIRVIYGEDDLSDASKLVRYGEITAAADDSAARVIKIGRSVFHRSTSFDTNSPNRKEALMRDEQVPVLIVGGGGAGLTASQILSTLNVESLLVSALPDTSVLPKAHVLNQRTMEIFNELGVGQDICRRSTPRENMTFVAWYAGLAGSHDWYG